MNIFKCNSGLNSITLRFEFSFVFLMHHQLRNNHLRSPKSTNLSLLQHRGRQNIYPLCSIPVEICCPTVRPICFASMLHEIIIMFGHFDRDLTQHQLLWACQNAAAASAIFMLQTEVAFQKL